MFPRKKKIFFFWGGGVFEVDADVFPIPSPTTVIRFLWSTLSS